jgi:NADH:ubiquinone oxidoreductase subunit E/CheY-like chemotaxis protein
MEQAHKAIHDESRIWPQILVMEDEMSVAKGLELVLSEEGYTVDLAMTGRSALDSFSQKAFDLLIADLRLPDIDGMEVIKKVKNSRPDTEVIVVTGYSTVSSAVEAMKLGATDYLSKPFTDDELMSAVKVALHEKKMVNTGIAAAAVAEPPAAVFEPLPEDLRQVQEIMARIRQEFSGTRDEVIPLLQGVQNQLGFIPESALEEIARFTRMPAASVYGIATFYEQFRLHPVGRHIVKVCRGTACHVKGADRILNEIETRFGTSPGQTSENRLFTLETVACFGSCAIAPVVVVDDAVKGRMDPTKTTEVMEEMDHENQNPNQK